MKNQIKLGSTPQTPCEMLSVKTSKPWRDGKTFYFNLVLLSPVRGYSRERAVPAAAKVLMLSLWRLRVYIGSSPRSYLEA